jgi:hypothetical protein
MHKSGGIPSRRHGVLTSLCMDLTACENMKTIMFFTVRRPGRSYVFPNETTKKTTKQESTGIFFSKKEIIVFFLTMSQKVAYTSSTTYIITLYVIY